MGNYKLIYFAAILLVLTMWGSTAKGDLVAWYRLQGNAHAEVGVDGMLVNNPTPAPDHCGIAGNALNFAPLPPDSGSYVSVPGGAGLPGLSQGTIAMWVNWSGPQEASFPLSLSFGNVLGRQSDGVYSNNIVGIDNMDPALGKVTWHPYSFLPVLVGATPVGDGAWHFLAVTFDGVTGAQLLYLDGTLDGSGTATGTMNADVVTPLTIGAWIGDGAGYSSSTIHDVLIYNTVLSQSDIQDLQAMFMCPCCNPCH
jgi:hypothetical protein